MEVQEITKKNTNLVQPKLRFKEFSDTWRVFAYGSIYKFMSTNSLSRDYLNYGHGEIKNIHYGDIHTKFKTLFDINQEQVPFINADVQLSKYKDENFCQEQDLIIADASEDYNDIGKTIELINLDNQKVLAGLHTLHARPNKSLVSKGFPGYLVQTWNFRKQVMVIAQGTKVLGISSNRMASLKLNIPSLPEQQKIATFLSAVDKKIQLLSRKKELLNQYKKGVMQQLFSGKLRFKDENGKDFPKWKYKTIGETCEVKRGASPRPITDPKWFDNNSKIGWVRISDVTRSNKYLENTEQYLSKGGVSKSRLVSKGNMIMSICATIGKPIYTKFDVCIHDGFVVFENLSLNKEYLFYYLDSIQDTWYKYGQPGTQVNLNSSIVSNETIPAPEIKEQEKIASFLSNVDSKINNIQSALANVQLFKKGLLQQMFV